MSMIGWVQALSPAQIGSLREEPSRASAVAMAAQLQQMDVSEAEALNRLSPEQRKAARARRRAFEQSPAAKALAAQRAQALTQIASLGPFAPALEPAVLELR